MEEEETEEDIIRLEIGRAYKGETETEKEAIKQEMLKVNKKKKRSTMML